MFFNGNAITGKTALKGILYKPSFHLLAPLYFFKKDNIKTIAFPQVPGI